MEKGGFNNSLRDSRKIFMKKAPQPGQSAQQAAIQTKPMGVSARAVTFAANSKIVLYMEIVSIEKKTFEEMVAQTDAFVEKVAALQRKGDAKRLGKWLTGEEVCEQLRISQRTLQKLRDRGFIGYSQIGFRFYYKPEDVKRLIPLIGTICSTDR